MATADVDCDDSIVAVACYFMAWREVEAVHRHVYDCRLFYVTLIAP